MSYFQLLRSHTISITRWDVQWHYLWFSFLVVSGISKRSVYHLEQIIISHYSALSILARILNALMKGRGDKLILMHPWMPYEGVISSVPINDKKMCPIFYMIELSF